MQIYIPKHTKMAVHFARNATTTCSAQLQPPMRQAVTAAPLRSRRRAVLVHASVSRTAFSFETKRLTKTLLTRQALKTALNYMSETNGEMHFWLHNYVSDHPLPLDGSVDADEWLITMASTPLTKVQDPSRSSVVSAASVAAALNGEREVSPREVAQRLLSLREHISKEMVEDLGRVAADNADVMKRTLEKTFTELKFE